MNYIKEKRTVIYIMSDRRSGSTLLENILSKSPESVSLGELALLGGHILKQGAGEKWEWRCSCGKSVSECGFWSAVLHKVPVAKENIRTKIKWNSISGNLKTRAFFPALFKSRFKKLIAKNANQETIKHIFQLYHAIFEHTHQPFIIDSSKDPIQALAIYQQRPIGVDVKLIWLKRDIRAIATSKAKWKNLNEKNGKSVFSIMLDVFYYKKICSTVASQVANADMITVGYKSLAQQTQAELNKIFSQFGLTAYEAPEFMELKDDHTIGGTPGRFLKKPILYDEQWKEFYKNKKSLYYVGEILNRC